MGKRLLFVVNDPGFFVSHRLPVALAARHAGYDVHVATGPGSGESGIVNAGLTFHRLPLSRSGRRPIEEMRTIIALYALFRRTRPDIVHLVTIKAVLYGGLAAKAARIPSVVAAVSGLGSVFIAEGARAGLFRAFIQGLYRRAFSHRHIRVIFQNPDDRAMFVRAGAIPHENTVLIRGSGVRLTDFAATPEPAGPVVVAMASRLLKDKGVREFVAAARELKSRHPDVEFLLVGDIDPGNPVSLTREEVDALARDGIVEVLGHRRDVAAVFARTNIVVLPSYREGLPKVLMEAAACGRAVVTTDVPGCRDALEPGKSGIIVPMADPVALAQAIERLILDPAMRSRMGAAGRFLAEREFAIERVIEAHLAIYRELLHESRGA